jgi:hypothetical protein
MKKLTEALIIAEQEGEINAVDWLETKLSSIEELFEIDKQCKVLGQVLYEYLAKCLQEVPYDSK